MAVSRHLGYYRTGNSAIRSADPPIKPLPRTKHGVDRMHRFPDIAVYWSKIATPCIWSPHWGEAVRFTQRPLVTKN